jgi:hypothetical protein
VQSTDSALTAGERRSVIPPWPPVCRRCNFTIFISACGEGDRHILLRSTLTPALSRPFGKLRASEGRGRLRERATRSVV